MSLNCNVIMPRISAVQLIRPRIVLCFLGCSSLLMSVETHAATSTNLIGYVLRVELTPAICALDKNKQKQRQCLEGYALTIGGLLPETAQHDCETNSTVRLSPIQSKVVARIMPNETARVQLWEDVGGCLPMSASQYFRTIIGFAEKLKIPAELTDGVSRNMQQTTLKQEFIKLNSTLKPSAMRLNCQVGNGKTLLTEIQICYQPNGLYKQCSSAVVSNCPNEISILGSY